MPIISTIEAKQTRGRLLHAAMFLALALGGVAMIYPFLLVISGSVRSEMDGYDLSLVPAFLVDDDALYRKLLEYKYNENVAHLNRAHGEKTFDFRLASPPKHSNRAELDAFETFLVETKPPQHWRVAGGIFSNKNLPGRLRDVQDRLADRFGDDLDAYSKQMGAPTLQWSLIKLPSAEGWMSRQFDTQDNPLYDAYFAATDAAPRAEQQLMDVGGYFLEMAIFPIYGQSTTAAYNKAHAKPLGSYADFALLATAPTDDPQLREEWIAFVRRDLNPSFVTLPDDTSAESYTNFLRAKYGTIDALNLLWSTRHADFSAIPLPTGQWLRGMERQDYAEFLAQQPPESYRLIGPGYAWQDWLRAKHGTIERLNAAFDTNYTSIDRIPMPIEQQEYRYVVDNARRLRWEFATNNYRFVFIELFEEGNGFRNTMILCALAVLAAIIVNPLAAYALSRYRLRGTYNILLILMATVAFPPMVTLIPKFILLREMNLLNTFAALVLPFAANGYLLLKNFFDSLPRELYEAAEIDGASEPRIFWQITMSLSKPILAVVALEAFNAAYAMFLYALIVCPAPGMWLQTVWLSQFQFRASTGPVFAAVLVMCLPTLLIFVLAQRMIMRGIIVPTEK
ncbi:MAG: ABC transporter permease subunit [Tepidisphaeraceae bacterium]